MMRERDREGEKSSRIDFFSYFFPLAASFCTHVIFNLILHYILYCTGTYLPTYSISTATASMPDRQSRMLPGVPNVVDCSAHKALDLLKALVRDEVECPVCLDNCSDTHINPACLHRFCGDCIKESLRKCNTECPSCRIRIPTKRTLRKDKQFDNIVSFLSCVRSPFAVRRSPCIVNSSLFAVISSLDKSLYQFRFNL